jgi:hypothetical protein
MRVIRFPNNPIIRPHMDGRMGANINGASLIRVPEWIPNPLGKYYLYFGHHCDSYIRLAFADDLAGPWKTHEPGVMPLDQSPCHGHVSSPDLIIDEERRELRLYYHGPSKVRFSSQDELTKRSSIIGGQWSFLARSKDGLNFESGRENLGPSYFRVFGHGGWWYALAMPGLLLRSRDGVTNFEAGPLLFSDAMRHSAVLLRGNVLHVFYSNAGDCPEHILHATIDVSGDWLGWKPSQAESVLKPELDYEGADCPLEPSKRGLAVKRVRQLRDPAVFEEDGRTYLLYAVAGEHGIAIAELQF